jgi:hypothetical protein
MLYRFGYGKWSHFSIGLFDGKGRGVMLKDCFGAIVWGSGG